MQLDDRLQALADFVPIGCRAADIGTDHGYLAIALIREGKAGFVVAGDLNEGPYEAAKRTVHENAIAEDQISVRLGNGLQVLAPGEVDTVCIAGMGGVLMTQILEQSPDVVKKLKTLVLQPMNGAPELRKWLYRHSWHIADEKLAVADGRIYEIIKAERGRQVRPEPIDLLIGPVLWQKKSPLLKHHIESLLFQQRRVLTGMEKSPRALKTKKYAVIKEQVKELEERLTW
ncbi:tRNA (adenine22-N1)-methyltransferase [Selenomonas sp. GACV-9]|uniref:tRNA (adenine(22)-N(1))-methyltransferase n=1 Tax=Selenomonas sp. GACV-9 TaxID=3158782 RepID=UPI0008DFE9F0|nr:tRNA (adenine22-N1)-methyltransferase [Selenomonas ruminantium]